MKYWEIVADKLSAAGFSWGYCSAVTPNPAQQRDRADQHGVYQQQRPDELLILIAFIDQRLGAMEREHAAACRARMKVVGQSCFDSGALVCEGERVTPLWIDV